MNTTYTVRSGDTLYSIAKKFGITASQLSSINNLTGNTIRVGQILTIPNQNANETTYTVKAGDTLYGISNQFGVSVTELASLNDLIGKTIRVGQVLKIPSVEGTNPSAMFIYTVKKGDSLYAIAKKYETTVQKIIDLNYLKSPNLSIGQQLRVPENYSTKEVEMPNYVTYTVKKGDSLYSIAKKYNVSVDQLLKDNALTNNNLSIGQTINIRVPKESDVIIEECIGNAYTPPSDDITYTVKKGDSLYSIAKKYNVSVDNIKRKNNLTSNSLSIGQVLKI